MSQGCRVLFKLSFPDQDTIYLYAPGRLFPFSCIFWFAQTRRREKSYSHAFCYELFSILAIIMASFFMLFWDTLTYTLFGAWYEMSAKLLLYSSPFLLFNFLMQIDFQILSASGRPRTKTYILLAGVCVNLITNYIFLNLWWVVWSAFASGIGWLFLWILTFRQTRKFSASFRWSILLQNAIWIWLLTWILFGLQLESIFHGRLALFAGIVLVIALYSVVFIGINWSEFRRFQRIFRSKHLIW